MLGEEISYLLYKEKSALVAHLIISIDITMRSQAPKWHSSWKNVSLSFSDNVFSIIISLLWDKKKFGKENYAT